jgi:hypothetical protein
LIREAELRGQCVPKQSLGTSVRFGLFYFNSSDVGMNYFTASELGNERGVWVVLVPQTLGMDYFTSSELGNERGVWVVLVHLV